MEPLLCSRGRKAVVLRTIGKERILLDHFRGKRIMIDPGVLPADQLCKKIGSSLEFVTFISVLGGTLEYYRKLDCNVQLLPDIESGSKAMPMPENDPYEICSRLLNDSNLWLLMDRYNWFRSAMATTSIILMLVVRGLEILEKSKPNAIFFMATPHNIRTWVFAKVAETLGVEIYYFQYSIFPWRAYLYRGLSMHPVIVDPKSVDDGDLYLIKEYLRVKKLGASEALPEYERKRIAVNAGKYFNIRVEIKRFWKRPDLILNKYVCYRRYQQLSKVEMPNKYVVLFLHFQPERTTVPEGGLFAQQALAATMIRKCLNKDVKLIIKEHPSTFTNVCDWKQRTPKWYQVLVSMGAELADMSIDAYTLIDNAVCAVSVAGTVVGESIIRGTPAVYFGAGPMLGISSDCLHRYHDVTDLKKFLDKCIRAKEFEPPNRFSGFNVDEVRGKTVSADIDPASTLTEVQGQIARCSSILNFYERLFYRYNDV